MSTASALESLPASWSPVDDAFFRVVASVFPPEFTAGAGALLGSYDDEEVALTSEAAAECASVEHARRTAVHV